MVHGDVCDITILWADGLRRQEGRGRYRPHCSLTDNKPLPHSSLQSLKQAETSRLQEELAKVGLLSFPWTYATPTHHSPPAILALAELKEQSTHSKFCYL